MVVRVADGDHRFVLVPGDREIAWPKLRALLGVNRLSMPDADTARRVTGYVRGTITPLGSDTALPVIADADGHRHGLHRRRGVPGSGSPSTRPSCWTVLGATVADVTDPSP